MSQAEFSKKRRTYDCKRCGDTTDAFDGTKRHHQGLCRGCFGKRVDRRPRELNELDGKEWATASRSVEHYPDVRSEKQREHGASFPQSLAEHQISIYTQKGDVVLDPFLGVGTTLDACIALGRKGIGVDLNRSFLDIAGADIDASEVTDDAWQELIEADSRELTKYLEPECVDFILTSPPYGELLKTVRGAFAFKWQEQSRIAPVDNPRPYSEREADLGNMDYEDHLDAVETVMAETLKVLRPNAYAVWVVKDFRATKKGIPFVPYHAHVLERAELAGFQPWDIRIYDQTKFRPLVCLGFPSRNFYLNIGHSYLLVFKKP